MLTHAALRSLTVLLLLGAAAVAPEGPAFSNPTHFTNAYAPFTPGSVQVFGGRKDGARTTTVVMQQPSTRTFLLSGALVACGIVEQQEFENGALVEVSYDYLAQDDAGNVCSFGAVSFTYANGKVAEAEEDSWLVGGATEPSDPPGAFAASAPMLFMPAAPKLGDTFVANPVPGLGETLTIIGVNLDVKVPAGAYAQVIELQELDDGEDGNPPGPPGFWWRAPGVGVVREKAPGARSELIATSLTPASASPEAAAGSEEK